MQSEKDGVVLVRPMTVRFRFECCAARQRSRRAVLCQFKPTDSSLCCMCIRGLSDEADVGGGGGYILYIYYTRKPAISQVLYTETQAHAHGPSVVAMFLAKLTLWIDLAAWQRHSGPRISVCLRR